MRDVRTEFLELFDGALNGRSESLELIRLLEWQVMLLAYSKSQHAKFTSGVVGVPDSTKLEKMKIAWIHSLLKQHSSRLSFLAEKFPAEPTGLDGEAQRKKHGSFFHKVSNSHDQTSFK